MIDFNFECDGPGGITLMERSRLSILNRELAAVLNIVVDVHGESELRMDYPNMEWTEIWHKAKRGLSDFCSKGLMFVGLLPGGRYKMEVHRDPAAAPHCTGGFLNIKDRSVIFLETGELIQKILYPQLPLRILAEVSVDAGRLTIDYGSEGIEKGVLSVNITPRNADHRARIENVVDFSGMGHMTKK